ncbi:MBOAT-domain-containing protein [Cladochytrium replicatum]|nr:MBOAT-domain-containing protein [Cladochytrium replicatum]
MVTKRPSHMSLTVPMESDDAGNNEPLLMHREQKKPKEDRKIEFTAYYVIVAAAVVVMTWCAYDISKESNPQFASYKHRLSKGWIPGFNWIVRDTSDAQYGSFRKNLPSLAILSAVQVALTRLILPLLFPSSFPFVRQYVRIIIGLAFLFALYGSSALKILAIITINFAISRTFGSSLAGPLICWGFGIGLLFSNHYLHGYQWSTIGLGQLDSWKGLLPRWWINFNFTLLRMISYSMDYHRKLNGITGPLKRSQSSSAIATSFESPESESNPGAAEFGIVNYAAYMLYVPLYMAGPIVTFTDFIKQSRDARKSSSTSLSSVALYGIRWLSCFLLLELMAHAIHVVAIKDAKAWSGFSAFQMSMVGFWNLKNIWLKLLVIWRFFRLWAMAEGIESPENMTRCMSNNYSAMGFWRHWHRSYNRWLVKYLYVPLGGRRYYLLNIWVVFSFVAVWHDIELRLLYWGWLVVLFILPEFLLTQLTKTARYKKLGIAGEHISAFGGTLNVYLMMTANLVGFAVGVDGIQEMLSRLFTPDGVTFILCSIVAIFSAVHLMFRWEEDGRKAKDKGNQK